MKKHLMTTTALVTAGLLAVPGAALAQKASKPTLSLGGWVEGIVGFADQDDEVVGKRVDFDSQYDSEIHIKGQATLDNGIRITTRTEFEGEVSGDQIDEAWIAVSGSFGQITIGSTDNAAKKLVTPYSGQFGASVGQNQFFDITDWIATPSGFDGKRSIRIEPNGSGADFNTVSYFTPRIEGFQLGVGYIPAAEECQAGVSNSAVSSNVNCNSSIAVTSGKAHSGWAVGANFDRKFDQVRVGLAAGISRFKPAGGITASANNFDPPSDPTTYAFGGRIEYQGFKIAVAYKQERGITGSNLLTNRDADVFDVGAVYSWGKNAVSLNWTNAESPGSKLIAGKDRADWGKASYRRTLGPGVEYRLNLWYADFRGESPGTNDDNDGFAVTTAVRVNF